MPTKVLNLYAGIGGNRKLWQDVEVTAVENNKQIAGVYKTLYPNDAVIIDDAHQFLLDNYKDFGFVWSSPPCPTHSAMQKATRHEITRYPDMRLYQEIIFLKHFFKGKWVVENVKPYYEPLIKAQEISRHLFWCNFYIPPFRIKQPKDFVNLSTVEGKNKMMDWLGIHYEENIYYENNHCPVQVLRNCVHPNLGAHVFEQSFKKIHEQLFK